MSQLTYRSMMSSAEEEKNNSVHSPFYPLDIRPGDQIQARIRHAISKEPETHTVRVWKLSPMGIEFLCELPQIKLGSQVDLEITLNRQACHFNGMVVSNVAEKQGRRLVGIRWCEEPTLDTPLEDRRLGKRWICGNEFLPMGMAANPMRFDDFIHFRVKDVSPTGMQILTSMRNKLLVPGMALESIVTFPMMGQVPVNFRIANARVVEHSGRTDLSLGVKFIEPSRKIMELIGQYVLQFGPQTTVDDLKKSGLIIRSVTQAVEYTYVRTMEDYRDVLELRHACYSAVGKLASGARPEDTADRFDAHARILVAKYRGKAVGSLRIVFPDGEAPLEHEQFFALPAHFPRRDEIAEVTRVCTHPDFRGQDLLMGLLRRCVLTILQSKRRYTLGCSTAKLLPFYKKIGLKPTGIVFNPPDIGGEPHEAFLGDNYGAVLGQGVGPLLWNIMYSDLQQHLSRHEIISFGNSANVRLAFYRMLRPVATMLLERQFNRVKKS